MAEMLLVNARKRGAKRRKSRSPAQRAATRKMVAANKRRGRSGGRRKVTRARRRNPVNTFGRPTYGYRRKNPARRGGFQGVVNQVVMPAAMGATGALALDIAWGYLPIPLNLKTGMLRHVVKAGGAIALGYLTNMVATKSTADQMTRGAMTVVIHGAMREMAQQFMPQVPLDGLSYYSAGAGAGVGAYVNGMGAYVGAEGAPDPYLAADTLYKPFAGPSAASMARAAGEESCIENESNMAACY